MKPHDLKEVLENNETLRLEAEALKMELSQRSNELHLSAEIGQSLLQRNQEHLNRLEDSEEMIRTLRSELHAVNRRKMHSENLIKALETTVHEKEQTVADAEARAWRSVSATQERLRKEALDQSLLSEAHGKALDQRLKVVESKLSQASRLSLTASTRADRAERDAERLRRELQSEQQQSKSAASKLESLAKERRDAAIARGREQEEMHRRRIRMAALEAEVMTLRPLLSQQMKLRELEAEVAALQFAKHKNTTRRPSLSEELADFDGRREKKRNREALAAAPAHTAAAVAALVAAAHVPGDLMLDNTLLPHDYDTNSRSRQKSLSIEEEIRLCEADTSSGRDHDTSRDDATALASASETGLTTTLGHLGQSQHGIWKRAICRVLCLPRLLLCPPGPGGRLLRGAPPPLRRESATDQKLAHRADAAAGGGGSDPQ